MAKKKQYKYSIKELAFCYEYIANQGNATQAYKASYSAKKDSVAGSEAHKLLKKPKIQVKIEELTKKHFKSLGYKAEDVLRELAVLAFSDMSNHIDFDGNKIDVKSFEDMGINTRCVKKFEIQEQYLGSKDEENILGRKLKFELHDKKGSLELLGKNLKLFTDKVEHSGNINKLNDEAADAAYQNRINKNK